jgi:hypothetical protein
MVQKTNKAFLKNFYCSEYDPLMPTEDDVRETSDAEAMRILKEEDEADPAANASATAAASDAATDPAAAQTCAVPARVGAGGSNSTESSDTMDTTDPSKARMDPAPESAIFKTPEALPAKAPGKSGQSGCVPPSEQSSLRHGSGSGSGPRSGSGSSSGSSSSSDSEYSSAFSSCERNELPPLYYTVKKARASSLAPRVLGQGPDNNFLTSLGTSQAILGTFLHLTGTPLTKKPTSALHSAPLTCSATHAKTSIRYWRGGEVLD